MAKTNLRQKAAMSDVMRRSADRLALAAGALDASSGVHPASSAEGAALIRAFVRLERREIREAVTEFVTRLSETLAKRPQGELRAGPGAIDPRLAGRSQLTTQTGPASSPPRTRARSPARRPGWGS